MKEENTVKKEHQPRGKDKKKRNRRTKKEMEAARELSTGTVKRGVGRPSESKDKKERKRRPRIKKIEEVLEEAGRVTDKFTHKKDKEKDKEEEKRNIKIVVVVVKADGNFRFKIKREKMPELAPAEELVFKITYERNGVPLNSVIKEVRGLAEALIESVKLRS